MTDNNKIEHHNETKPKVGEKQPQLDLEFSHVERVTPRKVPVQGSISVFAKLQNILSSFSRSKADVSNTNEVEVNDLKQNEGGKTTMSWNKPESWSLLKPLPEKHRRIFVVLLALILILLLILWLKPSTPSQDYQSFQAQNNQSLPIEFQSLDGQIVASNPQLNSVGNNVPTLPAQQNIGVVDNTLNTISQNNTINQNNVVSQNNVPNQTNTINRNIETASQVAQNNTQVSYQQQSNTTVSSSQPTSVVRNDAPPPATVGGNELPRTSATKPPVVEAKPAVVSNNTNSRTLTISQGVSLMQVFRNNNLNISDVNAMTKATGAAGVLSSFKAGDQVRVEVNAQGRVTRLTLKNGSYFTRNSDGTYSYKR